MVRGSCHKVSSGCDKPTDTCSVSKAIAIVCGINVRPPQNTTKRCRECLCDTHKRLADGFLTRVKIVQRSCSPAAGTGPFVRIDTVSGRLRAKLLDRAVRRFLRCCRAGDPRPGARAVPGCSESPPHRREAEAKGQASGEARLWAELLTLGALLLSSSVTLESARAVDPVLAIALRTFYFALIGFVLFVITWLLSQISQLLVAAEQRGVSNHRPLH